MTLLLPILPVIITVEKTRTFQWQLIQSSFHLGLLNLKPSHLWPQYLFFFLYMGRGKASHLFPKVILKLGVLLSDKSLLSNHEALCLSTIQKNKKEATNPYIYATEFFPSANPSPFYSRSQFDLAYLCFWNTYTSSPWLLPFCLNWEWLTSSSNKSPNSQHLKSR